MKRKTDETCREADRLEWEERCKMEYDKLGEQLDFARRLALIENEAMRLGLIHTMRKINVAVRMVGWEIAGTPELFEEHEKARLSGVR